MNYYKGGRSFPGSVLWHGAKKIFTVLNLGTKHFVALAIIIEKEKIDMYDCNINFYSNENFVPLMMPMVELFLRFLKQCKMFYHLPDKLLNSECHFERLEDAPRNNSIAASGSYSFGYIEHLITTLL